MRVLKSYFFWTGLWMVAMPLFSYAQNFGGVPPGKSWSIKGSDHIDIIYDKSTFDIADTVLSIVDWINLHDPYSLGDRRENVKVVLRNENLTSNGFVGHVPFRSEFYLYGAQNPNTLGYSDWMHLLTLHEYRHVIQYSNLRWGISSIVRKVFGDAAQGGLFNLLVPDWFSEGDAVFFESAVSGNGRGQLPAFSAGFRALLLADKKYPYGKFRNGSFKDLVPNQYVYGYMLAGFGYKNFPDDFWRDVVQETSHLTGLFLPFKKAIKRGSGLKLTEFHDAMLEEYQQYLYDHVDTAAHSNLYLLPASNQIKNEIQLVIDSSGQKYMLENSFDEISTVYKLEGDKKRKIFTMGRTSDPYLILRGSGIYFTNSEVHSRWTNREYGDIYSYDINSDKVRRITYGKKYLSVDYQPGTRRYLAVQAGKNGLNTVVTFREQDLVVDTLLEDIDTYYSYPHWLDDHGNEFVFTGRKRGEMFLRLYDMASGNTKDLIPPTGEAISRPFVSDKRIYFSLSRSGIDNIYCYEMESKRIFPVTFEQIGAYNPTVGINQSDTGVEKNLYYSTKTAYGERIQFLPLYESSLHSNSMTAVPALEPLYVERQTVGMANKMQPPDTIHYTAKQYNPTRHLIHFHSLYLEPSNTTPQLSLLSNDYLNTTRASLYGRFFKSDQSFELGAEMTYAALYPELSINGNHRMNRSLSFQVDKELYTIPKSESSLNAGLSVPLNFSRRQYNHLLRFTARYGLTKEHFDVNDPALPGRINVEPRLFQTGLFNLDWALQRLQAYRDIFPRWGVTGTLLAKRSFSPGESWLLYAEQGYHLPGFFRNDGFKLRWQVQRNSPLAINYLPYELKTTHNLDYDYRTFRTGGLITLNYLFPLAYPEIAIPHVIYTKRIALNLFTEHFRTNTREVTWTGVDVLLTSRYFNLLDFTAGIRISRNWNEETEPYTWSAVFLQDL